ncbi:hypothetical protein [Peterkaempfera bronchialis]|uniref:Uncharacterized protein n=1 Tax=Peterkaempfera bronchialis TaxID=2126346 RepID=A0A345SWA4_9ACTN|nr:hypothetical protein [Peterkaempfera bronchialis]AXI78009.1 hypothetical protein C7M71_011745 [Peterkaempfera bronchialis]
MSDGWGAAPGPGGQQPQDGQPAGQQGQPQGGGRRRKPQQGGGPQASTPAGTTPQGLPQRAVPGQQPYGQAQPPFPPQSAGQPGGYGYPQQQGYPQQPNPYAASPQYNAPGSLPRNPQEPDWAALAERNDAAARRKKRLLMVGGGVLAAVVAGGVTATALGVFGSQDKDGVAAPSPVPSAVSTSAAPSPSPTPPPPPPVDPLEIIGSKEKDTAPLNVNTLFPDARLSIDGHTYDRDGRPHATANCAKAGSGGLGEVLARNKCRAVYRATYVSQGIAVTVGIVEFDTPEQSQATVKQATGNIYSLYRTIRPFCRGVYCRSTANSAGRYAYFTIGGFTDGKPVAKNDKAVKQATRDIDRLARNTLLQRGRVTAAQPVVTVPAD